MPTAFIIIRQEDGNTTPGSRDDLTLGVPVTLLNANDTGVTSHFWQFIDKPSDSSAVLNTPTQAISGFTPDAYGTYLIRLTINGGILYSQVGAAIKTTNLSIRIPAASESGEFNITRGWAPAVNDALKIIDDGYGELQGQIGSLSFTLDGIYSAGTNVNDSTLLLDTTRGGFRLWDNAVPLSSPLFEVASVDGTSPYIRISPSTSLFNNTVSLPRTSIDSNTINVLSLTNSTAATALQQQNSPAILFEGQGWRGGQSRQIKQNVRMVPAIDPDLTIASDGQITFSSSRDGGAAVDWLKIGYSHDNLVGILSTTTAAGLLIDTGAAGLNVFSNSFSEQIFLGSGQFQLAIGGLPIINSTLTSTTFSHDVVPDLNDSRSIGSALTQWSSINAITFRSQHNGIGTAQSAISSNFQNTTAAANNSQQCSPLIELEGRGWNAQGSISRTVKFAMQMAPVQQVVGEPLAALLFLSSINNSAYNQNGYIRSDGEMFVPGRLLVASIDRSIASSINIATQNATSGQIGSSSTGTFTWNTPGTNLDAVMSSQNGASSITSNNTAVTLVGATGAILSVGSTITATGNTVPNDDNLYSLGTAALRWSSLHLGPGSLIIHNDATDTQKLSLDFSGSVARVIASQGTAGSVGTRVDIIGGIGGVDVGSNGGTGGQARLTGGIGGDSITANAGSGGLTVISAGAGGTGSINGNGGTGGQAQLLGGNGGSSVGGIGAAGNGGNITIRPGQGGSGNGATAGGGNGGNLVISGGTGGTGGTGTLSGNGGTLTISGGSAGSDGGGGTGNGGNLSLNGGSTLSGTFGNILLGSISTGLIISSKSLLTDNNNAYDIGAPSGGGSWRSGYFDTSVITPLHQATATHGIYSIGALNVGLTSVTTERFDPNETGAANWETIFSQFDNPSGSRKNQVWSSGWNINQSIATEAQFQFTVESLYDAGLGPVTEYHIDTNKVNGGASNRPFTLDLDQTTGTTDLVVRPNTFRIFKTFAAGNTVVWSVNTGEGALTGTTATFPGMILTNNDDVPAIRHNQIDIIGGTTGGGSAFETRISQDNVPTRSRSRETILGDASFTGGTSDLSAKLTFMRGQNAPVSGGNMGSMRVNGATGNIEYSWSGASYVPITAPITIVDPGNGNAISVDRAGVCALTSGASGQTRTLAIPSYVGQEIDLIFDTDGGGNIVITVASAFNQAGNTTITVEDAGDYVKLSGITIGGTRAWRLVVNDGATLG